MNPDEYASNAFVVILLGCAIVAYLSHTDIQTVFQALAELGHR